ncbi:hypothetical protein Tco_0228676 [Tanacetum coccineum]
MMMTHSWEPLLFDQVMEKSDSNVEFMPDDEIISIYGDDDEEDASDRELFIAEGVVTDHVVDEYHTKVNKEDTHTIVSATTTKEVSFVFVTQSDPVSSPGDVKEIHITKEARSDPFGNLPQKMDFLAAQVHNLTKSLPNQFADKMNSVASSVPSLISHVVAQQLPNLLTLAIKYILPRALTNAVRETFFRFNMRIRTAIKGEMPANLTTSVLKLMYKEFNALKKLESKSKIGEVTGLLKQCTIHQMQLINYMEQILHSSVKVPKDILVVNVKHLHTKVDKTSADVNELVGLVSRTIEVPTLAQEEPQTADASDGQNSSALVAHEQELDEIKAHRIQHLNKMRDEYIYYISFGDDPLPITEFNYKVRKSSKIATMRVIRNNQPLNYKIFDEFKLGMETG